MALAPVDAVAHITVIVLGTIVLVQWLFYSLMLYSQMKNGRVRSDWWISQAFYAGIVLLVLGTLMVSASSLAGTQLGGEIALATEVIALLAIAFGFRMRMKNTAAPLQEKDSH